MTEELTYLRGVIDDIDTALIHMLAGRFGVTERIGQIKGLNAMPVRDPQREIEHINTIRKAAANAGLEPDIAESVIRLIMGKATERHKRWQQQDQTS